jgi:hypothetical protein
MRKERNGMGEVDENGMSDEDDDEESAWAHQVALRRAQNGRAEPADAERLKPAGPVNEQSTNSGKEK